MPLPARVLSGRRWGGTVDPHMGAHRRGARSVWVLCLMIAIGRVDARAQALSSIEFSFSNPGARSLGFGGAFVALADDATAAVANPAGLVLIAEPEVSVEVRSWSYSTPFTAGGRAVGTPTGRGIDTLSRPVRETADTDSSGLSFVSYVYPRKHWSLAIARHQLADFDFGLETQGVFGSVSEPPVVVRTTIQRSDLALDIVAHGAAFALRPLERLSLGLGVWYFTSEISILGWDFLPNDDSASSLFERATFRPERLTQVVELRSDDSDWGLSAGFLWRFAGLWSLGGVYREAPDLTFEAGLEAGPAHPVFPAGVRFVDGFRLTWRFPDVYGLGIARRSRDGRWTGALEWRRVEYSSILESFLPQQRDPGDRLDDAEEIRLGGEYAFFVGRSVVAVRVGIWHDPDHQIRTEVDPAEDPFLRAILPGGDDQLHYAAGFGAALERAQIDLAFDLSERVDTISLSAIYSF